MKIITDYNVFLNENVDEKKHQEDISKIMNCLLKTPTKDILKLKSYIEKLAVKKESLNENFLTDFFDKMRIKFRKSVDDKIWTYLINRKQRFYLELAEKLNIFDLTTLDDVIKNHPGFVVESLYLAGGMDKAKDVGAGWRLVVENEFEKMPGKPTGLPEISLGPFGNVEPKRVVDGEYLNLFLKDPKDTKDMYNFPLVLNPVRKEVDRTKNTAFLNAATMYKTFTNETEPEDYEPTLTDIRKTMTKSIEPDDEHLVRISDFILLGLNQAAAAGTYGELQTQSFMNKPIFVYMTSPEWKLGTTEDDPFGGFSMWTFPHISKLARNESEMKILVATIMTYAPQSDIEPQETVEITEIERKINGYLDRIKEIMNSEENLVSKLGRTPDTNHKLEITEDSLNFNGPEFKFYVTPTRRFGIPGINIKDKDGTIIRAVAIKDPNYPDAEIITPEYLRKVAEFLKQQDKSSGKISKFKNFFSRK